MKRSLLSCVLLLALSGCNLPRAAEAPVENTPTAQPPAATATLEPTAAPEPTATPDAGWSMETRVVQQNVDDPKISIYAQYPALVSANTRAVEAFDQATRKLYDEVANTFIADLTTNPPPEIPDIPALSTTYGGYTVACATTELVSLTLDFSQYVSGAVHPVGMRKAMVFGFQQNRPLTLEDVFAPGSDYLPRLAESARDDLATRELLFFEEGAAPTAENYDNWLLTAEGFTVLFDVYQVAPYAAGPQQVTVPYAKLADLLQPGIVEMTQAVGVNLPVLSVPIVEPPSQ